LIANNRTESAPSTRPQSTSSNQSQEIEIKENQPIENQITWYFYWLYKQIASENLLFRLSNMDISINDEEFNKAAHNIAFEVLKEHIRTTQQLVNSS